MRINFHKNTIKPGTVIINTLLKNSCRCKTNNFTAFKKHNPPANITLLFPVEFSNVAEHTPLFSVGFRAIIYIPRFFL